jgi:hypothetical protein
MTPKIDERGRDAVARKLDPEAFLEGSSALIDRQAAARTKAVDVLSAYFGDGELSDSHETFDLEIFEKATLITAGRLASFRLGLDCDDPYAYDDDELLKAGFIVGSILAEFELTPISTGEV